jgi:hypothetical protein
VRTALAPRALAFVLVFLGLSTCGSTGRTRRTFPVEVTAKSSQIVTDTGWTVTLSAATVHLEALRFFEGKVLLSRSMPWWRGLLVSEAWAHPGHYVPGEALGELVSPAAVDLLASASEAWAWSTANAVTGEYGSAQLTIVGTGLALAGTATKGAAQVEFSVELAPAAALEGLRFEHTMTSSAGAVQLLVDLSVILSRVDFAQVGTGAKPIDPTSPAFNGLTRGLEDTSAYVLTWKED